MTGTPAAAPNRPADTINHMTAPVHTREMDGTERWTVNGKLHRDDGPALIDKFGDRWWYRHGELHRDDGPAGEHADASVEWFRNGLCHRDNGPAVEGGPIFGWYINGQLHRLDGPAWGYAPELNRDDLSDGWYLHGRNLDGDDINLFRGVDADVDLVAELYGSGMDMADAITVSKRLR